MFKGLSWIFVKRNCFCCQETYPSFHYTSLLYLNDFGVDFQGGRFIFLEPDNSTVVIEPKKGEVLLLIDHNWLDTRACTWIRTWLHKCRSFQLILFVLQFIELLFLSLVSLTFFFVFAFWHDVKIFNFFRFYYSYSLCRNCE